MTGWPTTQSDGRKSNRLFAIERLMRYVYPLDPECPVVAEFMETLFGDPMMAMGAPVEDITEEFERRHRKECKRCQEYGIRERLTE